MIAESRADDRLMVRSSNRLRNVPAPAPPGRRVVPRNTGDERHRSTVGLRLRLGSVRQAIRGFGAVEMDVIGACIAERVRSDSESTPAQAGPAGRHRSAKSPVRG